MALVQDSVSRRSGWPLARRLLRRFGIGAWLGMLGFMGFVVVLVVLFLLGFVVWHGTSFSGLIIVHYCWYVQSY